MRRALRIAGVIAAVLVVAGGAIWVLARGHDGNHRADSASGPAVVTATLPTRGSSTRPASSSLATSTAPKVAPAGVDNRRPESVAAAYVTHAQSLDWHWAGPDGYLPAVKPLVTPAYWNTTLAPMKSYTAGGQWYELKAGHVLWTITVTDARVIAEAPRTPASCIVRVVYNQLEQGDASHGRTGGVPFIGYANVSMHKVNGRWLVAGVSTDGG